MYTKAEAADKLSRIDLSDFDELRDSIKKTLNEIRSVEVAEKPKPKAKVVVKPYAKKAAADVVDGVATAAHKAVKAPTL